jgi:hypothetical protein
MSKEWLLEQIYDSSFTVLGDNSAKEGDPRQLPPPPLNATGV